MMMMVSQYSILIIKFVSENWCAIRKLKDVTALTKRLRQIFISRPIIAISNYGPAWRSLSRIVVESQIRSPNERFTTQWADTVRCWSVRRCCPLLAVFVHKTTLFVVGRKWWELMMLSKWASVRLELLPATSVLKDVVVHWWKLAVEWRQRLPHHTRVQRRLQWLKWKSWGGGTVPAHLGPCQCMWAPCWQLSFIAYHCVPPLRSPASLGILRWGNASDQKLELGELSYYTLTSGRLDLLAE